MRRGISARGSQSQYAAAAGAAKNKRKEAATPKIRENRRPRRNAFLAPAGEPLASCSDTIRVTAIVTPEVDNVTAKK